MMLNEPLTPYEGGLLDGAEAIREARTAKDRALILEEADWDGHLINDLTPRGVQELFGEPIDDDPHHEWTPAMRQKLAEYVRGCKDGAEKEAAALEAEAQR